MKLPGSFGFSIPSYFSSSYEFHCADLRKRPYQESLSSTEGRQVGKLEYHLERFASFNLE
jgi:hypothetical protein